MKITIEAESEKEKALLKNEKDELQKKVVFEHVSDFFVAGNRVIDGMVPNDFSHYSSSYRWLLGMLAYSNEKVKKDFHNSDG